MSHLPASRYTVPDVFGYALSNQESVWYLLNNLPSYSSPLWQHKYMQKYGLSIISFSTQNSLKTVKKGLGLAPFNVQKLHAGAASRVIGAQGVKIPPPAILPYSFG